jgi:dihydrofolate synthase/folylpolyglutamate synthase
LEIENYLRQFPDFEQGRPPGEIPFRLDRTHWLLEQLGHPERRYRIAHIAGTKGKGSTATMLASIAEAAGLTVGLYTSPHLRMFNERITVNRQPLADAELMRIVNTHLQPLLGRLPFELGTPTAFELTTVSALLAFADAQVDLVVLETGLGGQLDATNAIERSDVAILTPISLDHTQILGHTIEQIARDKSGIIKPGSTVVSAPQLAEAARPIAIRVTATGSRLYRVGEDIHVRRASSGAQQHIRLYFAGGTVETTLPLAGEHQAINAATAALAAALLFGQLDSQRTTFGLAQALWQAGGRTRTELSIMLQQHRPHLPLAAIKAGLERVQLPGRFDFIRDNPMVIVDVAHNQASARALAATVVEVFRQSVVYVVGMLSDKDAAAFLQELAPTAANFVLVQPTHPRAMSVQNLYQAATAIAVPTMVASSVENGLKQAFSLAVERRPIVVTGSFRTVAEALAALEQVPASV